MDMLIPSHPPFAQYSRDIDNTNASSSHSKPINFSLIWHAIFCYQNSSWPVLDNYTHGRGRISICYRLLSSICLKKTALPKRIIHLSDAQYKSNYKVLIFFFKTIATWVMYNSSIVILHLKIYQYIPWIFPMS